MTENKDIIIVHSTSGCDCDGADSSVFYATPEQFDRLTDLLQAEEDDGEGEVDLEAVPNYIEEIEKNNLTKMKVGFIVTIDSYYGSYSTHNVGDLEKLPL